MKIPENGILIVQPKFHSDWVNNEYFLIDKVGNRVNLNVLIDYKDKLSKSPGILMSSSGNIPGEMPDGSWSSESPLAIHFADFIVFNKDTTSRNEKDEFIYQQRFDSLSSSIVGTCRGKTGL